MANYRQIHTKIWKDTWFFELSSDAKLLWIYLFSNERANLTGLYDLHERIIAFETGLSVETIRATFDLFAAAGKAYYEDGWVWVPNLIKYNAGSLNSVKIRTHIEGLLAQTPDSSLKARCIAYYNTLVDDEYRIDTLSIGYPTRYQEHEHEHEHEHIPTGADAPVTFSDWQQQFSEAQNKAGFVGQMFQSLYPSYYDNHKEPNYGFIGKLLAENDPDYLLSLIWQHAARPPTGDPVRFIAGVLKRDPEKHSPPRKMKTISAAGGTQ